MKSIISIQNIKEEESKEYGNKIYFTNLLTNNGIETPNLIVISENFYWEYLKDTKLKKYITDITSNIQLIKEKGLQEISKEIQESIKSTEIPFHLIEEIKEGYETLSYNEKKIRIISLLLPTKNVPITIGVSITKKGFSNEALDVIPRYINVVGMERIKSLILNIFASYFSKKIIEEKRKLNIPLLEPLGPIYFQRFIYADKSGYIHIPSKKDNQKDKITIEIVPGMIFSLNNQEVTPDEIEYDLGEQKILEAKLGYKKERYFFDKKTETIQKKDNPHPEELSITDEEIHNLAHNAKKTYGLIEKPIIIEFGVSGSNIFFNDIKYQNLNPNFQDEENKRIEALNQDVKNIINQNAPATLEINDNKTNDNEDNKMEYHQYHQEDSENKESEGYHHGYNDEHENEENQSNSSNEYSHQESYDDETENPTQEVNTSETQQNNQNQNPPSQSTSQQEATQSDNLNFINNNHDEINETNNPSDNNEINTTDDTNNETQTNDNTNSKNDEAQMNNNTNNTANLNNTSNNNNNNINNQNNTDNTNTDDINTTANNNIVNEENLSTSSGNSNNFEDNINNDDVFSIAESEKSESTSSESNNNDTESKENNNASQEEINQEQPAKPEINKDTTSNNPHNNDLENNNNVDNSTPENNDFINNQDENSDDFDRNNKHNTENSDETNKNTDTSEVNPSKEMDISEQQDNRNIADETENSYNNTNQEQQKKQNITDNNPVADNNSNPTEKLAKMDEIKNAISTTINKFIKINPNLKETMELLEDELIEKISKIE